MAPPLYEEYDPAIAQPPWPPNAFARPFQAPPEIPSHPKGLFRKKATNWLPAIDALGKRPAGRWRPEPPSRQEPTNLPDRSKASVHPGYPLAQVMNPGAAFYDMVAARYSDALSRSPVEDLGTVELEISAQGLSLENELMPAETSRSLLPRQLRRIEEHEKNGHAIINFKKTWLYKNSRLPPGMVPFVVHLQTWTLICRAAQASVDVYQRPRSDQREHYTDADSRHGTKATIIKSQPVGDRHLIIVAIRGSQKNLVDWWFNFRPAPTQPTNFLDDEGNACHAGYLQIARAMIGPVAVQLRQMILQDPTLATSSLLFTGHSAGGAVASLIYAHMLSTRVTSDLVNLAGLFKRIHCITFGVPPVSLLPLQKPSRDKDAKNVFLSFVNEGDLVVRANQQYMMCLARLIAAPAPTSSNSRPSGLRKKMSRPILRNEDKSTPNISQPIPWPVPDAPLSNPGRLVLLREKPHEERQAVEAKQITDEELRDVVFGDPDMHRMVLYRQRVDEVAFAAMSGREGG